MGDDTTEASWTCHYCGARRSIHWAAVIQFREGEVSTFYCGDRCAKRDLAYQRRQEKKRGTAMTTTNEATLILQIERLLDQVADRGVCKGCGAEIWWVKTRAGKRAPYTGEALNHFADCPAADKFLRGPR